MGETTLQDCHGETDRCTSNKHTALKKAALAFIYAQSHHATMEVKLDITALRQCVTPSFSHVFGPNYTVSRAPKLHGAFTIDSFIEHLSSMTPVLETWDIQVRCIVVDEIGESVVIRASYGMWVKGAEEKVENDVVWWLELEERRSGNELGEETDGSTGWKVRRSTEMVDGAAMRRIKELMTNELGLGDGKQGSAAVRE